MGQFENLTNQGGDHRVQLDAVMKNGGSHLNFSTIVNEGTSARNNPVAAPATVPTERAVVNPTPAPRVELNTAGSGGGNAGAVSEGYRMPVRTTQASGDEPPRPPRPNPGDSTSSQMGGLVTNAMAVGANVLAFNKFKSTVRADEVKSLISLEQVVKPETLQLINTQADNLTREIATKGRALEAEVEAIATTKPHAFQEITETMPARGPGAPPSQLIFKQVNDVGALTEAELQTAARAEYMRSLERTMVKDFSMPNTTTIAAFRTRQPYIVGLAGDERAVMEGLEVPLRQLEHTSGALLEQTTAGRLAVHNSATKEIFKGAGMLAGSFLASRGVDRLIYGNQSQGFLTTAFDCAAPLMLFTKMSPLAKVAVMVGGHEAVRGIEYLTHKNRDN